MNFTDLLHLLPAGLAAGALTPILYHLRAWRRDGRELQLFQEAFRETRDPNVLGYYAQMRCARATFRWPPIGGRPHRADNDRDPPTGAP